MTRALAGRGRCLPVGSCVPGDRGDGVSQVNADALVVVGVFTVLGPAAAVAAGWLITRERYRAAGVLLLLSVLTPTYGAAALNLLPLVAGVVLVVRPPRHRAAVTASTRL